MNSIFKQFILAFVLVSSFYTIFYIIIDLLIFQNNPYKSDHSIPSFAYENSKDIPKVSMDVEKIVSEQNETISQEVQNNLDKISLIEQFNPKVDFGEKKEEKKKKKKDIKKSKDDTKKKKDIKKPKHDVKKKAKKKKKDIEKPKMVIIIDDVAFPYQVKMIKAINLDITPSFIPSSFDMKKAKKLTKPFSSYMIHLPLEAIKDLTSEKDTLKADDSLKKIQKSVTRAKKLFSNANFLNNHTGSKFTSNKKAMKKLKKALKINNLRFVDSLTTSKSKARDTFDDYYTRDIFLDHFNDIAHVKKQIKKAINVAKENNLVIVIGHPRKNTINAIKDSLPLLQKEVNVVFIDDL